VISPGEETAHFLVGDWFIYLGPLVEQMRRINMSALSFQTQHYITTSLLALECAPGIRSTVGAN
jgi:hypothetical protein